MQWLRETARPIRHLEHRGAVGEQHAKDLAAGRRDYDTEQSVLHRDCYTKLCMMIARLRHGIINGRHLVAGLRRAVRARQALHLLGGTGT